MKHIDPLCVCTHTFVCVRMCTTRTHTHLAKEVQVCVYGFATHAYIAFKKVQLWVAKHITHTHTHTRIPLVKVHVCVIGAIVLKYCDIHWFWCSPIMEVCLKYRLQLCTLKRWAPLIPLGLNLWTLTTIWFLCSTPRYTPVQWSNECTQGCV